jgi:predicted RNA-binding protein
VNQLALVHYESLRDDWIKGADLIARLVSRSAEGGPVLVGFPRQWIPLFMHFDAKWQLAVEPASFISIASDLTERQLVNICSAADKQGMLRTLVETFACLDPLVADVLYKIDRRARSSDGRELRILPLTGWQSYGRPEVLALNKLALAAAVQRSDTAVLLPCARTRPYSVSKTHRRIWRELEANGVTKANVDKVVVSSIGVIPEPLWTHPVVAAYDSGVPDIYRILRLMRVFFRKSHYERVIDCLQFGPYSDCLAIVAREGLIGTIQHRRRGRRRLLPEP